MNEVPTADDILTKQALIERLTAELEDERTAFVRFWRGNKGHTLMQVAAAIKISHHQVSKYMAPDEAKAARNTLGKSPVSIARTRFG